MPLEAWFCTYCILPLPWSFVARPLGPFPLASPTTISQILSSLTTFIFHSLKRGECVRKAKWKIYMYLWWKWLKKKLINQLQFSKTCMFSHPHPLKKNFKNTISDMDLFINVISLQKLFYIYSVVYCMWIQWSLTQLLPVQCGVARTEPVLEEALLGCFGSLTRFEQLSQHLIQVITEKTNTTSTHRALDI